MRSINHNSNFWNPLKSQESWFLKNATLTISTKCKKRKRWLYRIQMIRKKKISSNITSKSGCLSKYSQLMLQDKTHYDVMLSDMGSLCLLSSFLTLQSLDNYTLKFWTTNSNGHGVLWLTAPSSPHLPHSYCTSSENWQRSRNHSILFPRKYILILLTTRSKIRENDDS